MDSQSDPTRSPSPSASKPSKFVCAECGRAYKATETLNRHKKNHLSVSPYVCDSCPASFKRKDLLDRHSQIHRSESASNFNRARSQQACTRCSTLKTKCDSQMPCSRCSQSGHTCTYKTTRRRSNPGRELRASPKITSTSSSSSLNDVVKELPATTAHDQATAVPSFDPEQPWGTGDLWMEDAWPQHSMFTWPGSNTASLSVDPTSVQSSSHIGLDDVNQPWSQNQQCFAGLAGNLQQPPPSFEDTALTSGLAAPLPSEGDPNPPMAQQIFHDRPDLLSAVPAVPFDQPFGRAPISPASALQRDLVHELAHFAVAPSNFLCGSNNLAPQWQQYAFRIEQTFDLQNLASPGKHLLEHFIDQYLENFHKRFPTRWLHGIISNAVPSHVYLVMASIGAAFADPRAQSFHLQLLNALRPRLISAAERTTLLDEHILDMIEALGIVHASILYFGNRIAFSDVPRSSRILVLLGRRIGLFDEVRPRTLSTDHADTESVSYFGTGTLEAESKRRTAHGIMRLEAFVSLLLGTRPSISYQEINVQLPMPDTLWLSTDVTAQYTYLTAPSSSRDTHAFSDLVRICLNENENLPNLRFDEFEALLFGLQHEVWRFSSNSSLARQLAADFEANDLENAFSDFSDYEPPDTSQSVIADMRRDYRRLMYAFRKCKAALATIALSTSLPQERKSLLASNLLYNVSHMRLRADLPAVHGTVLRYIQGETLPRDCLNAIHQWASTKDAAVAVESACSTWALISNELLRPDVIRAEFNILTHISLLHAAVIIWAYAGTRWEAEWRTLDMFTVSSAPGVTNQLRLHNTNNAWLMRSFAHMLGELQPLRSVASNGFASYHTTVEMLADKPLPALR